MNAYPKSGQSGFSLVELMVSIVILAIMVGLALPSFDAMLQNSQVRNAAESVLDGIQRARAEAVKQNRNIEFVLAGGVDATWRVQWVGGGGKPTNITDPIASAINSDGAKTVFLTVLPAGSRTLTFDGTGSRIENDAGAEGGKDPIDSVSFDSTVLEAADSRDLKVMIGAGGAARMCDPSYATGTPRGC